MSDNQYNEKRRIQTDEFLLLFHDVDYCTVRFDSKEVNRVAYSGTAQCKRYDGEWALEVNEYGHNYDACWFRRKDAICDRPTESANAKLKAMIPKLLNDLAGTPEFKAAATNGGLYTRKQRWDDAQKEVTKAEAALAKATEDYDCAKHDFKNFKHDVETRVKLRIA